MRIPITEGPRYKAARSRSRATVVKTDYLKPLFKITPGEYYGEKGIRKGLDKAREVYGAGGYYEFTGFPDYKFHGRSEPQRARRARGAEGARRARHPGRRRATRGRNDAVPGRAAVLRQPHHLRRQHDDARQRHPPRDPARRRGRVQHRSAEVQRQAAESARIFQGARGREDVDVQKTPNETYKVDVKLKLEEQNRNQLTFGAGVSEFEGFFGQLSFQTANFLGRGESLTLSLQAGSRAQNYSLAFTEPFCSTATSPAGINVFKTDIRYIGQFTQQSVGTVVTFGFPLTGFSRMFTNYSYERVHVSEINELYLDPATLARNPYLRDSLLSARTASAS